MLSWLDFHWPLAINGLRKWLVACFLLSGATKYTLSCTIKWNGNYLDMTSGIFLGDFLLIALFFQAVNQVFTNSQQYRKYNS